MASLPESELEGPQPRTTARGAVKTSLSRLVMVVCGLAIQVFLARALQPELYGVLAVVTSVIVWWQLLAYSLLGNATIRFVAAAGDAWREVARTSLRGQMAWGTILAVACFLTSPLIARLLGDPGLTPYLWLFTPVIPIYGMFEAVKRVLIGRRRFGADAASWVWYWLARLVLIYLLVGLGFGVPGAILAGIAATAVSLILAWRMEPVGLARAIFPLRRLVLFGLPLLAVAVLANTVTQMDLWFVKGLLADKDAAGHYGAAKYVFQTLFIIVAAIGGVVLPTLTKSLAEGRRESVVELVQQGFRFVLMVMLAAAALVGSCALPVVTLVFSQPYAAAGPPAALLTLAALGFGLRGLGGGILAAADRPMVVLWATVPLVPLEIALNLYLVPRYALAGAALATTLGGAISAAIMLVLVWRELRVLFDLVSLLRICLAAAVTYLVGLFLPAAGPLVLVKLAALLGVYGLMLAVTGELTRRDLEPLLFWRG